MRRIWDSWELAIATQILNLNAFFQPATSIPFRIFIDLKLKTEPIPSPQAKDLGQTSGATGSDSVEENTLYIFLLLICTNKLVILGRAVRSPL